MAEVSDADLQVLRGSKALLDKLLTGETKRATENLIKKHYPKEVTTTDEVIGEVTKPLEEKFDALNKKFDEYLTGEKGRKLDDKLSKDIAYLREERSFTEEGIDKLKKLMIEKEIPDMIVAADHWERQNPPQQQESSILQPSDWGFGKKTEDADLSLLWKDEDAWAEREATRVWNEEVKKRGQIIT